MLSERTNAIYILAYIITHLHNTCVLINLNIKTVSIHVKFVILDKHSFFYKLYNHINNPFSLLTEDKYNFIS